MIDGTFFSRSMVRTITFVAVLAISLVARGADPNVLGAGSASGGDEAFPFVTHAWIVKPTSSGGSTLFHLPPRRAATGLGTEGRGVSDGGYRLAAQFAHTIGQAAAWDDRVYVLERSPMGNSDARSRRVLSIRAIRAAGGLDLWRYEPVQGATIHPPLEGDGVVLGFAAGETGPVALTSEAVGRGTTWRLSLRAAGPTRWFDVELPNELRGEVSAKPAREASASEDRSPFDPHRWHVLVRGDRVLLIRLALEQGGTIDVWEGPALQGVRSRLDERVKASRDRGFTSPGERPASIFQSNDDGPALVSCVWTHSTRIDPIGASVEGGVTNVGEWLLRWCDRGPTMSFWRESLDRRGFRTLADVPHGGGIVIPIAGLDRMIVAFAAASASDGALSRITELSSVTGATLYDGDARLVAAISKNDVWQIMLLLVAITAVVLLFVVRADTREGVLLPTGFALAEPGRRMMATLLDFSIWAVVAATSMGSSLVEAFSVQGLVSGRAFLVVLVGLILGCVAGTIGEAFWGRSFGKMLTACEVIDAGCGGPEGTGPVERPSLSMCLLRNVLKWSLPPLGIVALVDPEWRHPGDRYSRSVVVIRVETDPA
ncbi:MAG: RDD family protein [Phycisphaerales bacterium]|nr:MAG: RDD family protein [Phycisphaerales bacterium]